MHGSLGLAPWPPLATKGLTAEREPPRNPCSESTNALSIVDRILAGTVPLVRTGHFKKRLVNRGIRGSTFGSCCGNDGSLDHRCTIRSTVTT